MRFRATRRLLQIYGGVLIFQGGLEPHYRTHTRTQLAAAVVQGLPRPNLPANIAPGGTQHCGGGKRTCVLYRVTVGVRRVRKATSTVLLETGIEYIAATRTRGR